MVTAADQEPKKAPRKARAPRRRILVQTFHLHGGVEVTIRFPEGAARWTSTQESVAISTGESVPSAGLPHLGQNSVAAGVLGSPAAPPQSWSNTDDRGLGMTRGTADPRKALAGEIVTPAPLEGSAIDFLDRVERSTVEHELASIPDEGSDLTAEDLAELEGMPS